jgi:ribonuclease BN (tRNA processing enzyme)
VTASVRPDGGRGGTLTVLGCDGSYPGPRGAASGYLVESGGVSVWLDAGPGTFANLQAVADPAQVDAVVLSHEHPDHWTDIESFAVWLRHAVPSAPVPVYAPPGLSERAYFGGDPLLAWRVVEPSYRVVVRRRVDGGGDEGAGGHPALACSFAATDHGPPTLAVRFDALASRRPVTAAPRGVATDAAHSLGYSADTGADWSPEELGAGLGVLLCEATYTREHEGQFRHLSGRQAGTLAAAAQVRKLVVTHRWPSVGADALGAEADEAFGRPVHQAEIGRVFQW